MIVIAKVVALTPAGEDDLEIDDVELNLDREEETKVGQTESKPESYMVEVLVEQLIAFSDL
jgi:hypothetical protein